MQQKNKKEGFKNRGLPVIFTMKSLAAKEYKFEKDTIKLFNCRDMAEIEKNVEQIFKDNQKILPKNKNAKILLKPNFNNDLNSLTGNSTDLRVIVSVLKALKKRGYKNITIADGPNCGINHIGIDVFPRLGIDKIAKMFKVKLANLNNTEPETVRLVTGKAKISKLCLEADFIINLPKIKTHMEAGVTLACKNYMGCFLGTEKRKMHDSLPANIVKLNEIIKTDLIIMDGLVCMEGNVPGDGIPKKVGVILSGHNPYLMDLLCTKLMGLDYRKVKFLKIAFKRGHLTKSDISAINRIEKIANFIPAKKTLFGKILLNNFFIGIRFMKPFQRIFDKGFVPWFLFKLGVRQDIYIHEDMNIKKLYEKPHASTDEKKRIKDCLKVYCPLKLKTPKDKRCIKCMYCYQILPSLIEFDGSLGAFKMQIDRFGKFVRED